MIYAYVLISITDKYLHKTENTKMFSSTKHKTYLLADILLLTIINIDYYEHIFSQSEFSIFA